MEKTLHKFIHSCIALIIATICTSIGVVLFIHANLGSDTITVFFHGLMHVFDLSLGTASRTYNIIALIFALLLSRKDVGWTTIVYALSTGYVMDVIDPLLIGFHIAEASFIIRLLCVLIGQLCIVFSFALLVRYGTGMDQTNAITEGIIKRFPISYTVTRTSIDVFLLVSGFLMGGVVGIGSIISMATTGFLTKWILDHILKERDSSYERNTSKVSE